MDHDFLADENGFRVSREPAYPALPGATADAPIDWASPVASASYSHPALGDMEVPDGGADGHSPETPVAPAGDTAVRALRPLEPLLPGRSAQHPFEPLRPFRPDTEAGQFEAASPSSGQPDPQLYRGGGPPNQPQQVFAAQPPQSPAPSSSSAGYYVPENSSFVGQSSLASADHWFREADDARAGGRPMQPASAARAQRQDAADATRAFHADNAHTQHAGALLPGELPAPSPLAGSQAQAAGTAGTLQQALGARPSTPHPEVRTSTYAPGSAERAADARRGNEGAEPAERPRRTRRLSSPAVLAVGPAAPPVASGATAADAAAGATNPTNVSAAAPRASAEHDADGVDQRPVPQSRPQRLFSRMMPFLIPQSFRGGAQRAGGRGQTHYAEPYQHRVHDQHRRRRSSEERRGGSREERGARRSREGASPPNARPGADAGERDNLAAGEFNDFFGAGEPRPMEQYMDSGVMHGGRRVHAGNGARHRLHPYHMPPGPRQPIPPYQEHADDPHYRHYQEHYERHRRRLLQMRGQSHSSASVNYRFSSEGDLLLDAPVRVSISPEATLVDLWTTVATRSVEAPYIQSLALTPFGHVEVCNMNEECIAVLQLNNRIFDAGTERVVFVFVVEAYPTSAPVPQHGAAMPYSHRGHVPMPGPCAFGGPGSAHPAAGTAMPFMARSGGANMPMRGAQDFRRMRAMQAYSSLESKMSADPFVTRSSGRGPAGRLGPPDSARLRRSATTYNPQPSVMSRAPVPTWAPAATRSLPFGRCSRPGMGPHRVDACAFAGQCPPQMGHMRFVRY